MDHCEVIDMEGAFEVGQMRKIFFSLQVVLAFLLYIPAKVPDVKSCRQSGVQFKGSYLQKYFTLHT